MSGHTPGPWTVSRCREGTTIRGADRSPVAEMWQGPNTEANSNYIAACPEMYHALLLAYVELAGGAEKVGNIVRAAIHKAEGRS
jgi:hypothetical protein